MACGIIHNFIREHDPDDDDYDSDTDMEEDEGAAFPSDALPEELSDGISEDETQRADAKRDRIAKAMWASYVEELQHRGM